MLTNKLMISRKSTNISRQLIRSLHILDAHTKLEFGVSRNFCCVVKCTFTHWLRFEICDSYISFRSKSIICIAAYHQFLITLYVHRMQQFQFFFVILVTQLITFTGRIVQTCRVDKTWANLLTYMQNLFHLITTVICNVVFTCTFVNSLGSLKLHLGSFVLTLKIQKATSLHHKS